MSDLALIDPRDAVDADLMVKGFLIDMVDGDQVFLYRRHTANWLRIVPLHDVDDPDFDDQNFDACCGYAISIEPID